MKHIIILSVLLALACDQKPEAQTSPEPKPETQAPHEPAASPVDDRCSALNQLAEMDPRKPVPLQPMMAWHQKQNMMEHLQAIQGITKALAEDDWEGVQAASKLIESSPQMAQMCQHMGAGAEGFTELALEFHKRADKIGEAAKIKDTKEVLRATTHTLEACTSCHAAYKQDVVDAATWTKLTGSAHQPSMHHGH